MNSPVLPVPDDDARAAARAARLRYVVDGEPGFARRRRGRGFTYLDRAGRTVKDAKLRRRFASLAIPPAWTEVWICRWSTGHIQATGRDDAGRKQYIYHPRWRAERDRAKFDRLIVFARALPRIRERVDADLELEGLARAKVLAAVVRLLETTLARVGNAEYAKRNDSYGLTTLRKKHVDADGEGDGLVLEFEGKGGKPWRVEVDDPRVVEVIQECLETPGHELFKYLDDDGVRRDVTSDDVNGYLREVAQDDVTAKDFRTWSATVLAATALAETDAGASEKESARAVVAVVKQVAEQLGNTPAICRQAYIHPQILDGAGDPAPRRRRSRRRKLDGLAPAEAEVLADLEAARRLHGES
jgi:DNA topoisomerase-1